MMPYFMPSLSGKHPIPRIIHVDDFCHAVFPRDVLACAERRYDPVPLHLAQGEGHDARQ
jgi:hypothetical protein